MQSKMHVCRYVYIICCYLCSKTRIARQRSSTLVLKMQPVLLNYVALCYVLVFYFRLKRWYCSPCIGGGRRTLKRLRQCAPQVLIRIEKQRHQCIHFLEMFLERRKWLQYGFSFYYGGHANCAVSWMASAITLYSLWNDVHADTKFECYFWSIIMFSGMAVPYCYGPWIGLMCSLVD